MNQDEIIRMAREADLPGYPDELKRFAALVAAAEREACIDINAMHGGSVEVEAAIRARGKA